MNLSAIIGIGGHALLLSAISLRIACAINLRKNYSYALAVVTLIVVLLPIDSLSVTQVIRGIFGDLSITSIILLGYFMISPMTFSKQSRQIFILVVITGVIFYPAALGLGMIDPYQWGYLNTYRAIEVPLIFLASLIVLLMVAGAMKNSLIMLCVCVALGAYILGAMESKNIWDYLIDPLVYIYGLFYLSAHLVKYFLEKNSAKKYIHT